MKRVILHLACLLVFFISVVSQAYPRILVKGVQPNGSSFDLDVVESGTVTSASLNVIDEAGNSVASLGKGEVQPINLWLLVDSSTLCRVKHLDDHLAKTFEQLKRNLHPESQLSIVSFTNMTLEIHQNHRSLKNSEHPIINCNPKALSTSYEKPLKHLLASRESSNLPTVVWVYTSGNIRLSKEALLALKKREAQVHLLLYNGALYKELLPIVRGTRKFLGDAKVRYSTVTLGKELLPEVHKRIRFSPPYAMRGKRVQLRLSAMDGKNEIKSAPFNLNVPKGNVLILRYLRGAAYFALFLLLCYFVYRVVRYYLPTYCPQCKSRVRNLDSKCLFCRLSSDAFLIGAFTLRDKNKVDKNDVVRLGSDKAEIGTHRKSVVPIVKPSHKRRACYATIVRESLGKNRYAFRLLRTASEGEVSIMVNGYPVREEHYLSAGDEIVVDDAVMAFHLNQSSEEMYVA